MNLPSALKRPHQLLSWRAWLLIFAIAALLSVIIGVQSRNTAKGLAVDIRINTNGISTVLGIPLGNGPVRDIALWTLSRANVRVRVLVPSGGSAAPGWETNSFQSINAITKAGLIPTNKPPAPNPYE